MSKYILYFLDQKGNFDTIEYRSDDMFNSIEEFLKYCSRYSATTAYTQLGLFGYCTSKIDGGKCILVSDKDTSYRSLINKHIRIKSIESILK